MATITGSRRPSTIVFTNPFNNATTSPGLKWTRTGSLLKNFSFTQEQTEHVRRMSRVCPIRMLPSLPLFLSAKKQATENPAKPAIIDKPQNQLFTYGQLLSDTWALKEQILDKLKRTDDLKEERIAFLIPSGYDYVVTQWATWGAGGIAVPLCTSHPFKELEYTISDSQAGLIILHPDFYKHQSALRSSFPNIPILLLQKHSPSPNFNLPSFSPALDPSRRALMIYTSGTTSRPKGCISTHATINFQCTTLISAWKYTPDDVLVHVLPLHHIHGIINALTATLLAGGTVEMYPKFDAGLVWQRWAEGGSTMFMAVPTVYSRLISYYTESIEGTAQEEASWKGAQKLRVCVSGSAALPSSVKEEFREITGQTLLERYGMTEIGMGLSCLYENGDGKGRLDGSVGWPLDGVEVRLAKDDGTIVEGADNEGEIQIRGGNVFKEYWNKPEATAKEFADGWFKTGDIAHRSSAGAYFIHGRASVDIIKSGGYKISALDVEREILAHVPGVRECAVVGLEDREWGQRVAAVVSFDTGKEVDLKTFRNFLRAELAPYKIPSVLKAVEGIERNTMGKVNKKELIKVLWPELAPV